MLWVDPDSTSALWLKTGPRLACGRMEGCMQPGMDLGRCWQPGRGAQGLQAQWAHILLLAQ